MLARRWLVLLIGVLLTIGGATAALQVTGVYAARTVVTLLPPVGWAVGGNSLTDSAATMVAFARVVEASIDESLTGQLFASPDAPLYGAGVRKGEVVYVPNAGGQWAPNFNRPVLVIDVVGPTASYVTDRVVALTADVAEVIDERQDEYVVADDQRIGWKASPDIPEVFSVGPDRARMLGGIAALGVGVSLAAAVLVDVLVKRRTSFMVEGLRSGVGSEPSPRRRRGATSAATAAPTGVGRRKGDSSCTSAI
ncbi:hypothetical protein QWJ90_04145 [Microbacterium oryzae]|nr:hypothetical protein [Microbacterium oryzae]